MALRRAPGELWLRRYDDEATAGPSATRVRAYLGSDFYVRRDGRDIWVRARRAGEPEIRLRKARLGKEWMTVGQAAAALEITPQWLRSEYIRKGRLTKHVFGERVLLRREDVDKIVTERKGRVGGAWLRKSSV